MEGQYRLLLSSVPSEATAPGGTVGKLGLSTLFVLCFGCLLLHTLTQEVCEIIVVYGLCLAVLDHDLKYFWRPGMAPATPPASFQRPPK